MVDVSDQPWTDCYESGVSTAHLLAAYRTTLFELISALQDAAGPDDDATVVAVVVDMLQRGRIGFLNKTVQRQACRGLCSCTASTV